MQQITLRTIESRLESTNLEYSKGFKVIRSNGVEREVVVRDEFQYIPT